ncbi:PREDICTED: uncharacterized protein LOC107341655 [Acropora digitifera]|uniref:uncharacterized protein LOC107341655 n=1 Tax=Acropora digitifera TaxID=70779 RepID=UPI00077A52E5|nr:PREDICTED: uncharacterized protein LOC107341655 [Acropora digitifera]
MFFLGRMLVEIQQITTIKKRENENVNGRTQRSTTGKYLSDAWNVLDFITLVIYLLTFFLRTITWGLSTSTINNRAIVVAGYFYGINTMLLTLRSFGQVMETSEGVGVIQIALFQMFGDITTIFWQFIAAVLAFSIAITKVYMAERSYISKRNNITQGLVCETPGMSCWWTMMKHLFWSLLGLAELDTLDSIDHTSVTIVHFLYGLFLVLGVILLVNMMIALLSNTYQKVQDNALREWSFRKAITLQTYSDYHPIPVPFNIVAWCWLLLRGKCCEGSIRDCRGYQGDSCSEKKKRSLDFVVTNLQNAYFAKYGNCFPVTDDGNKIDHIFQETKQSKQFANHISYETFLSSVFSEGTLQVGQKAWDSSGITVDGCRLTYQGKEICKTCKENVPVIYHGARYRVPFSPKYPHFEVLIQESGRSVGVGAVWQYYGNHAMPGCKDGTVGYIVNQGKVFGPCLPVNSERGLEYENAVAYRGDVIGCSVEFGDEENPDEVEIVFTLNGKPITSDKIRMLYTLDYRGGFSMEIYPYVCMTTYGTTVLAKMSSTKCVSPNGQMDTEDIKAITQVTSNIAETVNSKFKAADEVVQRCQRAQSNSLADVDEFMDYVTRCLEDLKDFLVFSSDEVIFPSGLETVESSPQDFMGLDYNFETEHLQFLSRKDGGGLAELQPPTDSSKKICDDLKKVDSTTKEKFDLLLKGLGDLEDNFQSETEENKKKRSKIQGKLQELRDLIMNRNSSNSVQ